MSPPLMPSNARAWSYKNTPNTMRYLTISRFTSSTTVPHICRKPMSIATLAFTKLLSKARDNLILSSPNRINRITVIAWFYPNPNPKTDNLTHLIPIWPNLTNPNSYLSIYLSIVIPPGRPSCVLINHNITPSNPLIKRQSNPNLT